VLAMSDASGFQDDTPFDLVAELLAPAAALEVLRLNRCLGLQLGIEGEGWRGACVRVCMCPGGGGGGGGDRKGGHPPWRQQRGCTPCSCHARLARHGGTACTAPRCCLVIGPPNKNLISGADVASLLRGKPRFRKLEFSVEMLSDPRDLQELRTRFPHVTFKAVD
jgi:hypothetical protein